MENYFNDPQLQNAQAASQQAAGTANASAQTDVSLPQMLRDTLNAKFNDNNPQVQDRNNAATAYLSSIPSSYNDVLPQNNGGVVLSPTQQAMMIQAKQNAYLSPLLEKNSMLASQRGSLADVIANVTQAHKANTDALTQKAQLAHQSYQDILGKLSAQADAAYKQQDLALRNKELGLQYGQIDLSGLLGGQGGGSGQAGIAANDRKSFQSLYAQQRNPAMQKAIENAWKIQNPGVPLFPNPVTGADLNGAHGTLNSLSLINEAQNILKKDGVPVGGLSGLIQKGLISNNTTWGLANKDAKRLNEIFTSLRTSGERNMVGGRLTGYLMQQLNPAFPDVTKPSSDIQAELNRMEMLGQQDVQNLAKSHGYDNAAQVSGLGVQNVLMLNPKGQTVRVPAKNIDNMVGKGFKFLGQ